LDLVIALNLNEADAGELLTLARQFKVGAYWYGRRGPEGPNYWDLWNYLGDEGTIPRSLAPGCPVAGLGRVAVKSVNLAPGLGPPLEVAYQGRRVLLIPPGAGLAADDLPAGLGPLEVVVLPAELAGPRDRQAILDRLQPRRLIVYGDPSRSGAARTTWTIPCQFTRQGAVTLFLDATGVTARQWQP
jgi:hypothetical protein